MQLFLGLDFGFGAHPVERVDVLAHGLLDGQGHFERALLFGGREILCHVDLAQRLAQLLIHSAGASLPALLLLFGAVQYVLVEIPVLGVEAFGQLGSREGMKQVPAQIGPDLIDGRAGYQRVKLRHELWLCIICLARCRRLGCLEVIRQPESASARLHSRFVSGVIQVLRVALFGDRKRGLRQPRFNG